MFSAQEIESVSSFLSRGGRALVLVDDSYANGLAPLLRAWGIELSPAPGGGRGAHASAVRYGAHEAVRDMDNVLTVFSSPCVVRPADSGPAGNRADKPAAEAVVFASGTGPGAEDYPVAAASQQRSSGSGGHRGATRLVVFGDSEFISNGILASGRKGNTLLLSAAVNWLAGSPRPQMPPAASDALDAGVAPDAWLRLVVLLAFAVPAAILLFGLLVWSPISNQL